jgi:tRNA(Ile)-lysidine synthase
MLDINRPASSITYKNNVKDRILATCQENELSYVEDPTNFQPEITLRNAIRDKIRKNSTPWKGKQHSSNGNQEIVQGLKSIQVAAESAKLNFNLDTPLDHLRRESSNVATTVREQEAHGECFLKIIRDLFHHLFCSGRDN